MNRFFRHDSNSGNIIHTIISQQVYHNQSEWWVVFSPKNCFMKIAKSIKDVVMNITSDKTHESMCFFYNLKVFCFYWTGFLDIFLDNLNETPLVKDYHEDYLDLNYFSSHFVVHRTKWYLVLVLLIWLQVIITKYIGQLQHDSILCKTKPEQLLILLIVTNHIF